MQIRVVRLESKNPVLGIALLIVILAILAFILTAGMALMAGAAAIGGAGYLVRRLFGGGRALPPAELRRDPVLRPEDEVFPEIRSGEPPPLPSARSDRVLPP